jgi:hypothetical protein
MKHLLAAVVFASLTCGSAVAADTACKLTRELALYATRHRDLGHDKQMVYPPPLSSQELTDPHRVAAHARQIQIIDEAFLETRIGQGTYADYRYAECQRQQARLATPRDFKVIAPRLVMCSRLKKGQAACASGVADARAGT